MAYETLIIEHEEPILIIKLNRPNALNALNSKLLEELNSALTEADNNDSVRTIISVSYTHLTLPTITEV